MLCEIVSGLGVQKVGGLMQQVAEGREAPNAKFW